MFSNQRKIRLFFSSQNTNSLMKVLGNELQTHRNEDNSTSRITLKNIKRVTN